MDAAADQKHGGSSGHRQRLHEIRRGDEQAPSHTALQACSRAVAGLVAEVQATIIKLDNAGDQAIHTHRHQHGNPTEHGHLRQQRADLHRTERDGDDFG